MTSERKWWQRSRCDRSTCRSATSSTIGSILLILAALWSVAASAAPTNFVLLVECSPRMSARKEAVIDIAREFIATGVDERVRPGQNFEVWFFDQTLQADAVKMSWTAASAAQYAKYTTERIAAKRFDVQSDLSKALPSIHTLVKNSGEATVFILLDGFQSITGTPFDEAINKEMSANRDAFFAAKEPFLITLLGRDGKWIAGAVHAKLGSTIDIPEFPKPPQPEIAKSDLPPSLQAIAKKEVAGATPPPQPAVEPAPPKRPEPDPVLQKMLAQIAAAKAAPKPEPKIEPIPEPKVETKVEIPKPTEPLPTLVETNTAVSSPTQSEIVNHQSSIINSNAPIQAAVAITTPAPASPKFPWPILLAIFGLIAAGGVYAYMRMKESPPKQQASLISQAYDSNPDQTIPRLPGSPGMRLKIRLPTANPPVEEERPKRDQ